MVVARTESRSMPANGRAGPPSGGTGVEAYLPEAFMPTHVHRPLEDRFPHVPVPGERDPDTLVTTDIAPVSGIGFGESVPPVDLEVTMDAETIEEHRKEGGGR